MGVIVKYHIIFCITEGAIQEGKYTDCWKNANVVPVRKKESKSKSLIRNYRPKSLLPILGKIFERLIYRDLFNQFYCNNLFTKSQSGVMLGDSCIFHLLSIVHEINSLFSCNPTIDVRGVFLDISKVFDKVLESIKLLQGLPSRIPTKSSS